MRAILYGLILPLIIALFVAIATDPATIDKHIWWGWIVYFSGIWLYGAINKD